MNLPLAKDFVRFKKLVFEELASHREQFFSTKSQIKGLKEEINFLSLKLNKIIGKDGDEDVKEWTVNLGSEEDLDYEDEGEIDV